MWIWLLSLLIAAGALVAFYQYRAQARIYRPLASRQPERRVRDVPLGYEGLDLDEVSRANRRNESLERGQTNWLGRSGFFGRTDTEIEPLADDETYAARFHAAFQQEKHKD